jgi:hypothetical protein
MRRVQRGLCWSLAAALACGLLGCGGTSKKTSSSTTTLTSSTATEASVTTTTTTRSSAAPRVPRHHVGAAAASFIVKGADNSIPEYGHEASASERARVQAVLAAYLRARARGEWSLACTKLAGTVRTGIEQLGKGLKDKGSALSRCGQVLASYSTQNRSDPLVHGLAVLRVEGATAFALFHGPGHSKYEMTMYEEGVAWKVGAGAPNTYPIGGGAPPPGK